MKLSAKTIQVLREIINEKSQYRSGPVLVQFFNDLGFHDVYGQGFPSRWAYTEDRLNQLNGTATLDQCIRNVFAPVNYIENPALLDELLELFNKHLQYDDWNVYIEGKNVLFRKVNFDLHKSFKPDTPSMKTVDDFIKIKVSNLNISKLPIENSLIPIIKSRMDEIENCLNSKSPLATIFLSGSVLEGILFAIAYKNMKEFNMAKSSPKRDGKVKGFEEWGLKDYIDVSKELEYIDEDVKKFSHVLQDFRNYIHPYQQMVNKFNPSIETAKLCVQVVKIAIQQIINRK